MVAVRPSTLPLGLDGRFRAPSRAGLQSWRLLPIQLLTAWANDVGFEYVFSRQVETFASSGASGISTSGRSRNVIEAFKTLTPTDSTMPCWEAMVVSYWRLM